MNAKDLSTRLNQQAESVAAMLLPNGKRSGPHWVAGNVNGDSGDSLKVTITGSYAGHWRDFATEEHGDLIDLWAETKRLSLADALQEVRDHLGVEREPIRRQSPPKPSIGKLKGVSKITGAALESLTKRKIPEEIIARYKLGQKGDAVVFPFLSDDGERLGVKYTTPDKKIHCEKGGIPTLFGWQAVPDRARQLVITEGEIDALSVASRGFAAVSVPFGAGNHQWIENDWERLERFDDIVIWFDTDEPGQAGAVEVANRIGLDRCRIAKALTGKDANEMLQAGDLRFDEVISNAESVAHPTIRRVTDFRDKVWEELNPDDRKPVGFDLGWESSSWLRFRPSELIIVNGYNGHGKSELAGQLMLEAAASGKRVCVASMEMPAARVLSRLTRQAGASESLTRPYFDAVTQWLDDWMLIFDRIGSTDIDLLLESFDYARKRYGAEVFLIDSLMTLGVATDDYQGQKALVQRLMEWKLDTGATVFLVTHARKQTGEDQRPGKFDVRGAGEITDMADTVISIWRDKSGKLDCHGFISCHKQRMTGDEGNIPYWFNDGPNQFRPNNKNRPWRYVDYSGISK